MARRTVEITLTGETPLLMHAFPMATIEGLEKQDAEDQAKVSEYRTPDGKLYVPGVALQRALVGGATYSKGKGRASLQRVAAACLFVTPEYLILTPQAYIVDSRPVVVPATKGRIIRHRPRFDAWQITAELEFEDTLLSATQVRRIVDDTGRNVGLLDFRPEKRGPYGRFAVIAWNGRG